MAQIRIYIAIAIVAATISFMGGWSVRSAYCDRQVQGNEIERITKDRDQLFETILLMQEELKEADDKNTFLTLDVVSKRRKIEELIEQNERELPEILPPDDTSCQLGPDFTVLFNRTASRGN